MIQEQDISDTVCSDNYGIDPKGPIDEQDAGTVVIPETLPLYLKMICRIT